MARKTEKQLTDGAARKAFEQLPGNACDTETSSGALSEQFVVLTPKDIRSDTPEAPILKWLDTKKGEVSVRMGDLDGLGEGRVTIRASALKRICPALLPEPLESDHLFEVSLKTVVLQVQDLLRRTPEDSFDRSPVEFDTPIAQVAREDEGYFKLQKQEERKETSTDHTIASPPKDPLLTPADRPPARISQRSNDAESNESRVSIHPQRTVEGPTTAWQAEEPPCGSPPSPSDGYAVESRKRLGQEMLREIFMTEDNLGVKGVVDMIATLPKVHHAVVLKGGTILGGALPEGCRLDAAILVPALMRTVGEFERSLRSTESSALMLMGEEPLGLFTEGNIHILIAFEGRGLLPGVGRRIREIARALDAIHGE
jgi:hypothetical protein